MAISRLIEFEKLNNTRDLGGMTGADGRRIKSGKLIRSGHLSFCTKADVEKLSGLLSVIVDFRSSQEYTRQPDLEIPGAVHVQLPMHEEILPGISRDKASMDILAQNPVLLVHEPESAFKHMVGLYSIMVDSDYTLAHLAHFVDICAEGHDKAVLWHCTAGKDRAGFATVILQKILGVSDADIFADYRATDDFIREECEFIGRELMHLDMDDPVVRESMGYLFGTHDDFLKTLLGKIDCVYGSFDAFLSGGLGVTEEKKAKLREMYLE